MHPYLRALALSLATVCAALAVPAQAAYVAPNLQHAPYGEVHVVVPISTDDPNLWQFKLRNLSNSLNAVKDFSGNFHARVVLYGGGLQMLVKTEPKLREAIDKLRGAGVQFNVCNVTLRGMNLDWHDLYGVQESDVVPSGFLEVGWLGNNGWSVDPSN